MPQVHSRLKTLIFVITALAVLVAAFVVTSMGSTAEGSAAKVIVSLTWDDGRANQFESVAIQEAHGMKATYYINSGEIGSTGYYLTRAQLDAIAASGNEIGGHTVHHENLTSVTIDQATKAICDDRQTLADWYGSGAIRSFAYPFGANNADVQKIPGTCGYTSARTVQGIRTATTCLGCRLSETLPPLNPWAIAVPPSITSATTLDDLKFQVTQAVAGGGGWVIYTMHSLGVSGDIYNIDPAVYDAFLSWLAARSDVEVRTVGDVMATSWSVATTTTTSSTTTTTPPPPASIPVPLVNADLELDANNNGVSDCWLRGSSGTTTGTWKRTTDARSGTSAEEVTISAFTRGDRKLVQLLDNGTANGGCAPSVSDAATYSLSVWYRSTGTSNIVVFTRDGAGVWKYWKTGPMVFPSASWSVTTYSPGRLPAGTTAISYGLALVSAGTLATDDYSMVQDSPMIIPPSDPSVRNSSFETDSNNDGLADCWMRGGYGTSNFSFQRVPEARTGSWAQQLTIGSLSSGDRKIIQPLDGGQAAGGCAIDVAAGKQYWLSMWYRSDTPPLAFVYLRDSFGTWRFWISTWPYQASSAWEKAAFLTPAIPAGTTGISFGLGLTGPGTLTVDDASSVPA